MLHMPYFVSNLKIDKLRVAFSCTTNVIIQALINKRRETMGKMAVVS